MRFIFLFLVLLSGCAYDLTLYPRGGGAVAKGIGNSSDRSMEVNLEGETYRGKYVQGTSMGVGLAAGRTIATGIGASSSNQYSALLTSGSKAIRCEFMAETSGGNGVCVDSRNQVFDLSIAPK